MKKYGLPVKAISENFATSLFQYRFRKNKRIINTEMRWRYVGVTFICATSDFVIFLFCDKKEVKYQMVNLKNVVKLKDICFLQLYNSYYNRLKTLPKEDSIGRAIFDVLPISLKYRYFGSCYSSD